MVVLEETTAGVILPVKAQPASRRNGMVGTHGGALKLAVQQVAEKGKANAAIIRLLAEILQLGKNQIELVSGLTSGHKKFLISGVSVDELSSRIKLMLNDVEQRAKH